MLLSTSFFGSAAIAAAEAGPGAAEPFWASMNWEITRSRASSVYTASPWAALAGLRSWAKMWKGGARVGFPAPGRPSWCMPCMFCRREPRSLSVRKRDLIIEFLALVEGVRY